MWYSIKLELQYLETHRGWRGSKGDWRGNRDIREQNSTVSEKPEGWVKCCWEAVSDKESVQLLSRVRLCSPMDCSMPGFPVHHQLLEFAQTHVHQGSDAIESSHSMLSTSAPAFNLYWAGNFVLTFEIYAHLKRMFLMAPPFRWGKWRPRKSKEHGQEEDGSDPRAGWHQFPYSPHRPLLPPKFPARRPAKS